MALNPLRVALTAGKSCRVMASLARQIVRGGDDLRDGVLRFTVEIAADASFFVDQDEFGAVDEKVVGVFLFGGRFLNGGRV